MTSLDLVRDGGPAMYLLIAMSMGSLPWLVALAIAEFNRVRVPVLLWLLPPLALIFVGALGWLTGNQQATAAVAAAQPDTVLPMAAAGLAVSSYPIASAGLSATFYCLLATIALALPLGFAGRGAGSTPASKVVLPVALVGLGLVFAGIYGIIGAVFLVADTLVVFLLSRRSPEDRDDELRFQRGLLALGSLGVVGSTSAALAGGVAGLLTPLKAIATGATAPGDLSMSVLGGLWMAGLVLPFTLPLLVPGLRRRRDLRLVDTLVVLVAGLFVSVLVLASALSRGELLAALGY